MPGFLVRTLISAAGLWVAAAILPGISIRGVGTLIVAALLLGVANAVVRPVAIILTLPITVVTLGLFLLVINASMLALVAYLLEDFTIAGLGSAVLGSLVVGITGWLSSWFIGPRGKTELIIAEERSRSGS